MLARDAVCRIRVRCDGAPSTVADHVVPLSQGGGWELANGQGCCERCHNWKRARESREGVGG